MPRLKDREGTAVLEKLNIKTPEKTPRQQFFFSSSILLNDLKKKSAVGSRDTQ